MQHLHNYRMQNLHNYRMKMNSTSNDMTKYYIGVGIALVVIIILVTVLSSKSNKEYTSFLVETDMSSSTGYPSSNWGGVYTATQEIHNGFPVYTNNAGHRIKYETVANRDWGATQAQFMNNNDGWTLQANGHHRTYLISSPGKLPSRNKNWGTRDYPNMVTTGSIFKVVKYM